MRKAVILIALAMTLSLAACGATQTAEQQGAQTQAQENAQENIPEETQMETQEKPVAVNYGDMTDRAIRMEELVLTDEWDKVFPQSDEVSHRKVTLSITSASRWRQTCMSRRSIRADFPALLSADRTARSRNRFQAVTLRKWRGADS